jgi:hypothetical protein
MKTLANTPGPACSVLVAFLLLVSTVSAQSGRGAMHGYVAFEDISYNDVAKVKLHATVQLRATAEGHRVLATTQTGEHGSYDFASVPMGEYVLRISAPRHRTYETQLYIPSDFICSLATMLKSAQRTGGKSTRQ